MIYKVEKNKENYIVYQYNNKTFEKKFIIKLKKENFYKKKYLMYDNYGNYYNKLKYIINPFTKKITINNQISLDNQYLYMNKNDKFSYRTLYSNIRQQENIHWLKSIFNYHNILKQPLKSSHHNLISTLDGIYFKIDNSNQLENYILLAIIELN